MSGSIKGTFAFVAIVLALGVPQAQAKILLRIAFINHVKGDLFEFDRSGETDFLLAGTEVEVYDNKDGGEEQRLRIFFWTCAVPHTNEQKFDCIYGNLQHVCSDPKC